MKVDTIHATRLEDAWRHFWERTPGRYRWPLYHGARRVSRGLRWLARRLEFWTAGTAGDLFIKALAEHPEWFKGDHDGKR